MAARHNYKSQKKDHLREFRQLEFLVVLPPNEDRKHITRELQRHGANVKHLWPAPIPLPIDGDMIICELTPDIAESTPWLPGEAPLSFVLQVPRNEEFDFSQIRNCAPHGLLHSPITDKSIFNTIMLALDQFRYEQRLRSRINKLDDNLRSMRAVEQAKAILMHAKQISEEEAYRVLRRTAMERRITLGTLATSIVDTQELLW